MILFDLLELKRLKLNFKKLKLVKAKKEDEVRSGWLNQRMASAIKKRWFIVILFSSFIAATIYRNFIYELPIGIPGFWVQYRMSPVLLIFIPLSGLLMIRIIGQLINDYKLAIDIAITVAPLISVIGGECGIFFPPLPYNLTWIHLVPILLGLFVMMVLYFNIYNHMRGLRPETREESKRRRMDRDVSNARMRMNSEYHEIVKAKKGKHTFSKNPIRQKKEVNPIDKDLDTLSADWQPELKTFIEKYVKPYITGIKNLGLFEAVLQVLEVLHLHGDQASIGNDKEAIQIKKNGPKGQATVDVLKNNVSLLEHSINTAETLIEERKKNNPDYRVSVGIYLLCGLGHDLGKIAKIRNKNKNYQKSDHWIASWQFLEQIIPESFFSKRKLLNAVRNHHLYVEPNTLDSQLKDADQTARAKEIGQHQSIIDDLLNSETPAETTPEAQQDPLPENSIETTDENRNIESQTIEEEDMYANYEPLDMPWLDIEEVLKRIGEKINVFKGAFHEAVLHKGIVYINPKLVSKIIGELAKNHDEKIHNFYNEEQMAKRISISFRMFLKDHIPAKIGQKFVGMTYQIIFKNKDKLNPMCYIPVRISAFPVDVEQAAEERRVNSIITSQIKAIIVPKSH